MEEKAKAGCRSKHVNCFFLLLFSFIFSYGKSIYYKKFGFTAKFVFLFGLPQNSSYLSELAEHDDMVVGNFHDSFQNLTYKDSMFFSWVSESIPNLKYCYKGDDDILLNPFRFNKFLVDNKRIVDPMIWGSRIKRGQRIGERGLNFCHFSKIYNFKL